MAAAALDAYCTWMRSVGISWNDTLIQYRWQDPKCGGNGLAVYAKQDIDIGYLLCTVPKSAIISTKTSSIADLIQHYELSGGLGLLVAVLHEASLGKESKWYGYFQSMSEREYLPGFWTEEEGQLLMGTDIQVQERVEEYMMNTKDDFETHVLPLVSDHPDRVVSSFWTLENYRRMASLMASRSFHVDSFHGEGMVPLADAFNHKVAVVELEGYVLEELDAGGLGSSEADSEDGDMEEEESDSEAPEAVALEACPSNCHHNGHHSHAHHSHHVSSSGGLDKLPGHSQPAGCSHPHQANDSCTHQHHAHTPSCTDDANRDSREDAPIPEDKTDDGGKAGDIELRDVVPGPISELDGVDVRLEIAICSTITDCDQDVLEIVATAPVAAGLEIHNTYGEYGNSELVYKYGFALRQNPFNEVQLWKEDVLEAVRNLLPQRTFRRRSRFLATNSYVLEEDTEHFALMPKGRISTALMVALRAFFAPEEEFVQWQGSRDCLQNVDAHEPAAGGDSTATRPAHGGRSNKRHKAEAACPSGEPAACLENIPSSVMERPTILKDSDQAKAKDVDAPSIGDTVSIASSAHIWQQDMCKVIAQVAMARLEQYPPQTLEEDEAQLQGFQQQFDRSEGAAARVAALILRITEKEILVGVLDSLHHLAEGREWSEQLLALCDRPVQAQRTAQRPAARQARRRSRR